MTNARRHAAQCTIWVSLERDGRQARITVTDDGCGFDPAVAADDRTRHFGLGFMRERMEQIDGSVDIESRPGAGDAR